MRKLWFVLLKVFTHNLCDCCGFTEDDVYVTDLYLEGGRIQCKKCIDDGL